MKGDTKMLNILVAAWVCWVAVMANVDGADELLEPTIKMYPSEEGDLWTRGICSGDEVFIVGPNNLCLEADRFVARLGKCNEDKMEQKWTTTRYTIHPAQNKSWCLTANNLTPGNNILILPCDLVEYIYRTWFRASPNSINTEFTIESYYAEVALVLDVAKLDLPDVVEPNLAVLRRLNGGSNQKWHCKRV